ncbi:MAG TPA: hypothetical protein VG708_06620 [Mycobacteriales bacterium]|nr:hypothetical protein [Mycobacteriales bacterium]
MSADLAAAAGAVDARELQVARDILASDHDELVRFSDSLDRPAPPSPAIPAQRRPRPLSAARRRTLLTLPAIPLVGALAMTAATAAGVGPIADRQHAHQAAASQPAHPVQHQEAAVHSSPTPAAAATSTLHQLVHVVHQDPAAPKVMVVARHLHRQIAVLITTASQHPARLSEVKQLLTTEQHLLVAQVTQVEAKALAASQRLAAMVPGLPHIAPSSPPPAVTDTGRPTPAPATTPSHHTTKSHHERANHHPRRHQQSDTTSTPTPGPTPGELLDLHRLRDLGL